MKRIGCGGSPVAEAAGDSALSGGRTWWLLLQGRLLAVLVLMILPAGADAAEPAGPAGRLPYTIVDTGQVRCYDDRTEIAYPQRGAAMFGQDAQYEGNLPSYRNNGDGTVSDLNTGLVWLADPGRKMAYASAVAGEATCRTGGYEDWRLPSIKELYSLILFTGTDPDPTAQDTSNLRPFVDTRFFKFQYGRPSDGDRIIDSQWATGTIYTGRVMEHMRAMFGVNFADGRIKGYPPDADPHRGFKTFYVLYVRGNPAYGKNDFVDNGDGTVTDRATGLMWMQTDSAALKAGPRRDGRLDWREALQWAADLDYAGHRDWRLPNAKELHSIVDYTRSPDATRSAALDPVFRATPITNEGGRPDFGEYWTSTTHVRATSAEFAVYIAFGRALGFMSDPRRGGAKILMDVHGAGAQRCDLKSGDPTSLPQGRGPQGDVMRIYNLARCVRGGAATLRTSGPEVEMKDAGRGGPGGMGPWGPGMRGQGPPSGADWVRRLDRDGDGRVSRREFDGPAIHFDQFDRNHDGYISSDEAPTGPPPRRDARGAR